MLLGGDEFRRTQDGNNNAYCQDNATSWYDWSCLEQHKDIFRFARGMIAFRRAHPVLSKEQFYTSAEIHWFGPQGGLPNWGDPNEKQFACLVNEDAQHALFLMFNAGAEAVDFNLPFVQPDTRWHIAVDTSHEAPLDLFAAGEEPYWKDQQTYPLSPHSSAILLARGTDFPKEPAVLAEVK
jgi:glycogen operon protein